MFNPVAGRNPERRRRQLRTLQAALTGHGWDIETIETVETTAAAAALAREGRFAALIVCGGDGTLHALLQHRADWPLTLLGVAPPWGTANIMAHALGCPAHPDAAAAWLTRAWRCGGRRLPLGVAETSAGERYFIAIAGVGYDAALVEGMTDAHKRRWGKLAFAASAATRWGQYFPAPLQIEMAGAPALNADGLLFGLTRYYAGRLRLGRPAPGGAIALALRGAPRLLPLQGLALASVGLAHAPGVVRLPSGAVRIATPGRPLQLDGEAAGVTPVLLRLHPEGIRFLAPA